MATYAIGDVQGCYDQLQNLLQAIQYDPTKDKLWFAGDLVNRGPHSLEVLRFVKNLTPEPIIVLGNHDLHLLAVAYQEDRLKNKDTFNDVLNAPDLTELCDWLRQQKLFHHDETLGFSLVHAGIAPQWSLMQTEQYAKEVEVILQSDKFHDYFSHMYGNKPSRWKEDLNGWKRLRVITNYLTRMRFCDNVGRLELETKSVIGSQPEGYMPWFAAPNRATANDKIVFGHWAALGGEVDVPNLYPVDTGCVWGGPLSALRLDDETWFRVDGYQA